MRTARRGSTRPSASPRRCSPSRTARSSARPRRARLAHAPTARARTRSISSGSTSRTPTSASLLRWFTFLPQEEIASIVAAHEQEPHKREAQRRLAREMTKLVHGDDGAAGRRAGRAGAVRRRRAHARASPCSTRCSPTCRTPSTTRAPLSGEGRALLDAAGETRLVHEQA